MKGAGIGVTIAGLAFGLATVLLISDANTTPKDHDLGKGLKRIAAMATGVTGGIHLAIGVPLWIVGAVKVRKYESSNGNALATALPTIAIGRDSAALSWRF